MAPAMVRWSDDNWETYTDTETRDTRIRIHMVDIKLINKNAEKIQFIFFGEEQNRWENKDFEVEIKK